MFSRENVQRSLACIQEKTGIAQAGRIGLVLGSGLGAALSGLQERASLAYEDIAGFPRSTVSGHAGQLVLGELSGREVVVLSGRVHLYEGFSAAEACMPIRLLLELGCDTVILTNAAGSLDEARPAGSLMLIADHINMTGQSPLTGPNEEVWGPRFPDMSRVYDEKLRELARAEAAKLGIPLSEGIYMQVSGPQYETPAETRMFRQLGGDAIGMSTAIEAIAAAHMDLRVLAISCLTNMNVGPGSGVNDHADVVRVAGLASAHMASLVQSVVRNL